MLSTVIVLLKYEIINLIVIKKRLLQRKQQSVSIKESLLYTVCLVLVSQGNWPLLHLLLIKYNQLILFLQINQSIRYYSVSEKKQLSITVILNQKAEKLNSNSHLMATSVKVNMTPSSDQCHAMKQLRLQYSVLNFLQHQLLTTSLLQ